MSYRDFGPGWCNRCQQPVYHPQHVRPGFEGCQCEIPDLETWAESDALMEADYQRTLAERQATYAASPITRPSDFRLWKKRAKTL